MSLSTCFQKGSAFFNITWVRNMFLIHFLIEVEHWFGFALKLLRNIQPGYGLIYTNRSSHLLRE